MRERRARDDRHGAPVGSSGVLRLGDTTFAWALAGQTLVALAQPVVMSAVGKLAGEYLPVGERAAGIAIASAGGFVGMLVALLMGPLVGGDHLGLLLAVQALLGVLAAGATVLALRRPGSGSGEQVAIERGAARALWRQPEMRVLSGLAFLGLRSAASRWRSCRGSWGARRCWRRWACCCCCRRCR